MSTDPNFSSIDEAILQFRSRKRQFFADQERKFLEGDSDSFVATGRPVEAQK